MSYFVATEKGRTGHDPHDLHTAMRKAGLKERSLVAEQAVYLEEAMNGSCTVKEALQEAMAAHKEGLLTPTLIKFRVVVPTENWEFHDVCQITGSPSYLWVGPPPFPAMSPEITTYHLLFNDKTGEITEQ